MDIFLSLAIIVGCLALSAFFSGSETALLRLRHHELEEEIDAKRGPAALAIRDLLRSTSRLLVTLLFGNNVANILGASVASALAVRLLGADLGIIVSTAVMTILVFVGCEVLPKAVAARHPLGFSKTVALPLYLIHQALRPVQLVLDRFIEPFVTRITGADPTHSPTSVEEILSLARMATDVDGAAESQPAATPMAIIGAAAGAADMTVQDIMVERTEIVAFPANTAAAELLDQVLEERYTRVPIYDESIDQVLGIIHLKDLVKLVHDGGEDLRSISKNILRVPERKPILTLLTDMQRAFIHVAIVADEFDVTLGMVTQEDILEELVGEIRDEFDREELLTIRKRPGGVYEALGRVKVLDFNRETGLSIPAERGDTLAGLVFNELGRAPRRWEHIHVPGYEITVTDISGSRITELRVREVPGEPTERRAEA